MIYWKQQSERWVSHDYDVQKYSLSEGPQIANRNFESWNKPWQTPQFFYAFLNAVQHLKVKNCWSDSYDSLLFRPGYGPGCNPKLPLNQTDALNLALGSMLLQGDGCDRRVLFTLFYLPRHGISSLSSEAFNNSVTPAQDNIPQLTLNGSNDHHTVLFQKVKNPSGHQDGWV